MDSLKSVKSHVVSIAVAAGCCLSAPSVVAESNNLNNYLFGDTVTAHSGLPAARLRQAWLSEPELRISPEQDARGLNTETYALRFRPLSPSIRRSQKQLYDTESELAQLEHEALLGEALLQRYEDVIDLAELEAHLAIERQALELADREVASETKLSGQESYNIARLQRALLELEMQRHDVVLLELEVEQQRMITGITAFATPRGHEGQAATGLSGRLARPTEVESMLQSRMDALRDNRGAIERKLAGAKLAEAKQALALQKAETGFGLDLLELSYENKGIDSYNLTFGFRLPSRSFSAQRRSRDVIAAQRVADWTSKMNEERSHAAIQEVYRRIERFDSTQQALMAFDRRISGAEASTTLMLERHRLDLNKTMVEQHADVLRSLVHALSVTGAIYSRPLVNWLSER